MSGKGSKQRPLEVPTEKFNSNWDAIFNRSKPSDSERQENAWLKNEYYDVNSRNSSQDQVK